MVCEAAFAHCERPQLQILDYEGLRSSVADRPRRFCCGDGDRAVGVPAPGRLGPGRAVAAGGCGRRNCRAGGCGSPGYRQQARFAGGSQGRFFRAACLHAFRAFRTAAATSCDQRTPGTPPRSDGGRGAGAFRSPAGGCGRRFRNAGDDERVPQQSDDRSGKGHRHGHGHGLNSPVGAPAPGLHGHGNAFGRSSEHHHGLPRGHAKQAPTASLPAPTTPPEEHGGGNGHKGGKK